MNRDYLLAVEQLAEAAEDLRLRSEANRSSSKQHEPVYPWIAVLGVVAVAVVFWFNSVDWQPRVMPSRIVASTVLGAIIVSVSSLCALYWELSVARSAFRRAIEREARAHADAQIVQREIARFVNHGPR